MIDSDIQRIADALEKMVALSKKDSPWEIIAEIHESYGNELSNILDGNHNNFEVAQRLRSMQNRAISTANEIRTRMV